MALLLSIETSTHHFSCALHRDEKLIAFEESITEQSTASLLAVSIDRLFEKSLTKKNELGAVIIASGPGSYTGLRIGVATAKGICYALNIPLISINTLELMFGQFKNSGFEMEESRALFCPMLDARRMEVYCLLSDSEGNVVMPVHAKVIDEESFTEQLNERLVYFFGEGAEKCKSAIRHTNAKFVSGIKPDAATLGEMGFQKFLKNDVEDIVHFEPLYLKDFVVKKLNSTS